MGKKTGKTKKQVGLEQITVSSGNVFADFGLPNPEEARAKSDLAFLVRSIIKQKNLTQKQAAELIGIDQPKVSKITSGKLSEFTLEWLMNCLVSLGVDIEIRATKKSHNPSIHVAKTIALKRVYA